MNFLLQKIYVRYNSFFSKLYFQRLLKCYEDFPLKFVSAKLLSCHVFHQVELTPLCRTKERYVQLRYILKIF